MKQRTLSSLIWVALSLVVAALACNAPAADQPATNSPASRVTAGATAIPQPTLTPKIETPEISPARTETWSYPMLYQDGACPHPDEVSLTGIAVYLRHPEAEITPYVFITLNVYPEDVSTSFSLGLSQIGITPANESGYASLFDIGSELSSGFPDLQHAPEAIKITYDIEVYDQVDQLIDTPVQNQTAMFCSSDPEDVEQYRSAWRNRTVTGGPDLTVWQTLLRYDGAQPEGTFEMTVCNTGAGTASPFEGEINVNGIAARMVYSEKLQPSECADLFDPASTFSTFGVNQPGSIQVLASISPEDSNDPQGNNTFSTSMSVLHLSPAVDNLTDYKNCRSTQGHEFCWAHAPSTPMGENPHEVLKEGHNIGVIVPQEFEPLAALHITDLTTCRPYISEYLGIDYPTSIPYTMRLMVAPESMHAASLVGIELISPGDMLQGILSGHQQLFNWNYSLNGQCSEAHEITHLFVMDTPIPGWLNEGLATYIDSSKTIQAVHDEALRCTDTGIVRINSEGGEEVEPYIDLTSPLEQAVDFNDQYGVPITFARTRFYDTGACFWDYVERTYGHQAFQQVIQALDARRSGEWCVPFLSDIVNPALGTDISAEIETMFGFHAQKSVCDF